MTPAQSIAQHYNGHIRCGCVDCDQKRQTAFKIDLQQLIAEMRDDRLSLAWSPRPPCGKGYPHSCQEDGFHCDVSIHSRRSKWLEARLAFLDGVQ